MLATFYSIDIHIWDNSKAVANGTIYQSLAWVLTGPLLVKLKTKFHLYKKQVINKSTKGILGLVQLVTLPYSK